MLPLLLEHRTVVDAVHIVPPDEFYQLIVKADVGLLF